MVLTVSRLPRLYPLTLRQHEHSKETFVFGARTDLLLCLQTLWIYSPHVVGFCADIIVSLVLDKVHTGVICGLCSHMQTSGR